MHSFLDHLGLDTGTDERGIRRAYARQLKQIDPEQDPSAFQALREAYEAALWWVQHEGASEAGDGRGSEPVRDAAPELPSGLPSEQRPDKASTEASRDASLHAATSGEGVHAEQPADMNGEREVEAEAADSPQGPDALAHAVFDDFAQSLADAPLRDTAAARAALEQGLSDPRLTHLDARTVFEWRVANLLASGWAPGHEFLFDAAISMFHWDIDSRRLQMFGQLGHFIDAAIVQQLARGSDNPNFQRRQDALLQMLRRPEHPGVPTLTTELDVVDHMAQRYPQWLAIQAPSVSLAQWQRWAAGLPVETPPPTTRPATAPAPATAVSHQWVFWMICFGLFALTRILSSLSSSSAHMPPDIDRPAATALNPSSGQTTPVGPAPPAPHPAESLLPQTHSLWPEVDRVDTSVFTPERIAAMTRGKLTATTCADLSEWVSRMRGYSQPLAPAVDKRVIDCLLAKLWPRNGRDHLVTEALNRQNARLQLATRRALGEHKTGSSQDSKQDSPPPSQRMARGRPAEAALPPLGPDESNPMLGSTSGKPFGPFRLPAPPANNTTPGEPPTAPQ